MSDDHPDPGLRQRHRAARRAVDGPGRAHAARSVATRITTLVARRRPGTVGSYLPTDGEIDPTLAVDALRAQGWTIHLPVLGADRSMQFAEWAEHSPLTTNRYGIDEPTDPALLVPARSLDLVLVPCVAVDPAGNRLGFGAGYYDRALAEGEDPQMRSSRPRPLLIGVVFDVQIVESIPREAWDVPLDAIVSESATIMTGARTWPSSG